MTAFLVGDRPRIGVRFQDLLRNPADPDTIILRTHSPSGVERVYSYGVDAAIVRVQQGVYHVDLLLLEPGEWWVRWEGTGTLQAACEGPLQVEESEFATAISGALIFVTAPTSTPSAAGSAVGAALSKGAGASSPTLSAGATSS